MPSGGMIQLQENFNEADAEMSLNNLFFDNESEVGKICQTKKLLVN